MDRMELHFKLKFLARHSWQYRGLAFLDRHGHYRAFPLSLRGTDSEALYRIFDKKIEIRPEENFLLLKLTCSSFLSAPYWLVARQMQFPSSYKRMVAVFVVFTSILEFRISAVYMGRVPMTEHDSMPPRIANTAAGNVITGGTNRLEIKTFYP